MDPKARSPARTSSRTPARALALGLALALLAGGWLVRPAAAQAAGETGVARRTGTAGGVPGTRRPAATAAAPSTPIPVVERFDPATGRRTRRTVATLTVSEVLSLQRALARAGRDAGVRTGSLDSPTRSALAAFQRARGLTPCGCPSYATVVALGLEPRVVETVVAAGGRRLSFAHATTGPAEVVSGAAGGATSGPVSVSSEAGVTVVRGSGTGSADGRNGRTPAEEAAARAGPAGEAGAASGSPAAPGSASPAAPGRGAPAWPGYGEYWEWPYGVVLPPGGRGRERGRGRGRGTRHGGREGGGHGAAPRPPIPYAPGLPVLPPAGPGLPSSLPPPPKSGSGR